MKKIIYAAALAALMLTACGPTTSTSGGGTSKPSSDVSSTSTQTSTSEEPVDIELSKKEAKEYAQKLLERYDNGTIVEPNEYYSSDYTVTKTAGLEDAKYLDMKLYVNRELEQMDLSTYDTAEREIPYRREKVYKEGTGYIHGVGDGSTEPVTKKYHVFEGADMTFEKALTQSGYEKATKGHLFDEVKVALQSFILNIETADLTDYTVKLTGKTGDSNYFRATFVKKVTLEDGSTASWNHGIIINDDGTPNTIQEKYKTMKDNHYGDRDAHIYTYKYDHMNFKGFSIDDGTWTEVAEERFF